MPVEQRIWVFWFVALNIHAAAGDLAAVSMHFGFIVVGACGEHYTEIVTACASLLSYDRIKVFLLTVH